MATHDYVIADAAGAAFRADINLVLAAIVSQNSSASAPSPTFAYMWWYDTTNDILKQRNAANSAWIELIHFDQTGGLFRIDFDKGADIASASTTDIGAATGNYVVVTGTTTITALGTIKAGTPRWVRFAGVLTLTHNATSLILPGGADISTAAGDVMLAISEGSGNWRVAWFQEAAGSGLQLIGRATASASATIEFTWSGSYSKLLLVLGNVRAATDAVSMGLRTSSDGGSTYDSTVGDYTYVVNSVDSAAATGNEGSTAGSRIALHSTAVNDRISNVANEAYSGEVDIINPSGAVNTQFLFRGYYKSDDATRFLSATGGAERKSAADVDGIQIAMTAGNIAAGEFALYGIV